MRICESGIEAFVKKANFEKGNGLIPVVVQDASNNKVLMQAFMNEEALRLTLSSGRLHFWSRSREKIWLKGEESGHYSLLQNAILDCDHDAILFKAQQVGVICHTGKESCFHVPIFSEAAQAVDAKVVERIFEVIVDRIKNPTENSYVSHLISNGQNEILQKLGEEAIELILAAKDNRPRELIHETTDVVFHVLVLLAEKGFELAEVFRELQNRHQMKTESRQSDD